jgi:hypothetical protein
MIATIARICELEKRTALAELLRICKVVLEQIDYDNWNGGTYTWGFTCTNPARYAKISSQLKSIEDMILTHSRALIRNSQNDLICQVIVIPEVSAQPSGRVRACRISATDLLRDIESQRSLMIAVATGGPQIRNVDAVYQSRRVRIRECLNERELEDSNPFDDLWAWYGKWSGGDLPTSPADNSYLSYTRCCSPRFARKRRGEAQRERSSPPAVSSTSTWYVFVGQFNNHGLYL